MPRTISEGVSVVHDWRSGDGESAIEALFDVFRRQYREQSVSDQPTDNVRFTVKTDLLRQNPPDIWFDWPGANLPPYINAGVLADVTHLWDRNNLASKYLDGPASLSRFDGQYYAIPVNIHRLNNLFYNVELVEKAGVDPTTAGSPREFIEILEQVSDTGTVPLIQPMKNPWPIVQLWATILLGQAGPDVYNQITEGDAQRNSSAIETSLTLLERYMDFTPDNSLFLNLTDVQSRFTDEESAFFTQGDWSVKGFNTQADFDYQAEWDYLPFPGTEDRYVMNMDAAIAAKTDGLDDGVEGFLETAASVEGQVAFNKEKGSIPPRTDVPENEFSAFQQDQIRSFQRSRSQPPSIAHGLAATPDQRIELLSTFTEFASEPDVDSARKELVETFEKS
ncbi:ABC transporter substrate-binding protein [Halorhabdus rudnickae]|uniref:ABC transporter substrate-binding protein n=1 Tax=Halorhabdus rudnickae TaxID=1775544 RepID=UPI0010834171|nr:ABC transporter substrate-binding protein [Halorhabdus rudnickae]